MTKKSFKYYSLNSIDKKKAVYNMIFGERSNGKTYATLKKAVQNWFKNKEQFAYIRRWQEDIRGRRAKNIFGGLNKNNYIIEISGGEYEAVTYLNGCFYLCTYDEKTGKAIFSDNDLIGYTFALTDSEHNKSDSYPNVTMIIFDEFLTKHVYLQDEFMLFMNTISTIVRLRTNVKIYMLGNTVNKFCPYFKEMGLNHIKDMKQGTIDVYKYGKSKLTVAVEYCAAQDQRKQNNFYFAFNNPKLEMITSGSWELDIYPHLPIKYKPKDIVFKYFIVFNENIYQCEIIEKDDLYFTYIHDKTTPIKDTDNDLIYNLDFVAKLNYNRNIRKPMSKLQEKILWFYNHDRVFYQNNDIGDSINNYLKICGGF